MKIDFLWFVQEAMPILYASYASDLILAKGDEYPAYVFGLPADATFGRP